MAQGEDNSQKGGSEQQPTRSANIPTKTIRMVKVGT